MPSNYDLKGLAKRLQSYDGPPVRIMEVCGTHTHQNYKLGIRSLLPKAIRLTAGPGCPVCVTPTSFIDKAVWLAGKGHIVGTFGDLVRVPGGELSLAGARARGADVRILYSPLDAVVLARDNPGREVIFLAVGFETTTPASCLAVKKAKEEGIANFSILCSCKVMEPAYALLAGSTDAFLYPGHVSAITGMSVYRRLTKKGISGAVAGFTAPELLTAVITIAERLRAGVPFAENCYPRVVAEEGNPMAMQLIESMMEPCPAVWRGLGEIPLSGLALREEYAAFDARKRFLPPETDPKDPPGCSCARVLRGEIEPHECPLFGRACTPEEPVGACMVSSEGACSAQYQYGGHII